MAQWKRALVTGGAGFIGHHLAKALLGEGVEVVIVDNLSMGTRDRVPEGARLLVGDVRDEAVMAEALTGVDIVFHEAARVSIRKSVEAFHDDCDNNIMGTVGVLRSCARASVKKLVYASSMAVYANGDGQTPTAESHRAEPLSPYGISKLAGEKYCLLIAPALGIDVVALRYFNTFGPGQTHTPYVGVATIFINKLLRGESPVIFGHGDQVRDYVHVDDIVQANLRAMRGDLSHGLFNVGSGVGTTVNDLAALLCSRIAPDIEPLHDKPRPEEVTHSIADIRRAREMLGYSPQGTLADRIDAVIDAIRAANPPR